MKAGCRSVANRLLPIGDSFPQSSIGLQLAGISDYKHIVSTARIPALDKASHYGTLRRFPLACDGKYGQQTPPLAGIYSERGVLRRRSHRLFTECAA